MCISRLEPAARASVPSKEEGLGAWTIPLRAGVGRRLLYSFYPGKSAFFNMAVTESDLDPKVRKMPITFDINDVAMIELSMRRSVGEMLLILVKLSTV